MSTAESARFSLCECQAMVKKSYPCLPLLLLSPFSYAVLLLLLPCCLFLLCCSAAAAVAALAPPAAAATPAKRKAKETYLGQDSNIPRDFANS